MDIESKRRRGGKPKYSDALKRQVALEYLGGTATFLEIADRYNLQSKWSVKAFVRWYRLQEESVPAPLFEAVEPDGSTDLLRENAELRAQLAHERIRNLGLETMIDIAEKELEVDIRKKSVSKQSRP